MRKAKKQAVWQYYFARKFSLQRFEIVMRVFRSEFIWKRFDIRLKHMLVKPEQGGNHAIYFEPGAYERSGQKVFMVFCRNLKTFLAYRRLIKKTQQRWAQEAKRASRGVSSKTSMSELAQRYDRYIFWHQEHFNKPIWIIFLVEPVLATAAEQTLRTVLARAKKTSEYERWFEVVFTPEEQNAIAETHESLLRLAVRIKRMKLSAKQQSRALDRITERFGFIPCYDVIDAPWTREHFQKELRILLRKPIAELEKKLRQEISRYRIAHHNFQKLLRSFTMTKHERELLTMAHEVVFLKDERDDYRRLGCFNARPLMAEIGRRFGLTLKETCSMSIEETRHSLRTGKRPPSIELRTRAQGYVILFHEGQPWIFKGGKKAQQILKRELELGTRAEQRATEVQGLVGSSGIARGRVAIVHTKHDLRRMRDGDVMVAVTTNPDYVPAMRRCVAIVTNEGGISSHAAIVSRELGTPCIIGTKVATKVFKDGDLVEVNANHGWVRKIQ